MNTTEKLLLGAGVLGGLYFLATGKLKFGGTTQAAGSVRRVALPPVRTGSTPGSSQSFLPSQAPSNAGLVGGGGIDINQSGLSFGPAPSPFQAAEFSRLGQNLVLGIGHPGGIWASDVPRGGQFSRRNFGPHPHLSLGPVAGIGHAGGIQPMRYNPLQGAWVPA